MSEYLFVYEQLVAELEARFQVLDRIRSKLPGIPEEEVENDVGQAIDGVNVLITKE